MRCESKFKKPTRSKSLPVLAALAATLATLGVQDLQAQRIRYLPSESEIQSSETRTAMEALIRENTALENKLQQSETSILALQKNLATANAEGELMKRKASELMLRLEALGLDSAGDPARLEQKLLKAVNDLRLSDQDRTALREALIELSEASLRFQKASATEDAEAKAALEAASRRAARALGTPSGAIVEPMAVAATLTDGLVMSVNEELALVVVNIGRKHGVQAGMPFQVLRNGEDIGTVRVVDVRERICGAVIQDLRSEKNKIQPHDRLKVAAAGR